MNTAWTIGFAVGIMMVAVISAIIAKLARKKCAGKGEYDERQQIARGKAYTMAYATLLIYLTAWMILHTLEIPFFATSLSVFAGALLSIAVFVGCSIFSDAYFKASESPKTWIGIICAAGVINIGIGVWHLIREATVQEKLYENFNLFVGLLLVVTLIFIVVKRAMDRRAEE